MRLRLVSLAFLLLALCRTASGNGLKFSVVSKNTKSSSSSMAFTSSTQKKIVTEKASSAISTVSDEKKIEQIMDLIGNTLFTFGFIGANMFDKLPRSFQISLVNGFICELGPEMNEKIATIQGEIRAEEEKHAGDSCTASETTPDGIAAQNCFCKAPKKTLIYCILFRFRPMMEKVLVDNHLTKQPCRSEAISTFKGAAPELWKEYDLENFGQNRFADFFNGNVDEVSKKAAALFCEALNPKVEQAVKGLYVSDGMYWIAESLLYTVVFGTPEKSVTEVCQEPEFANNDYGKCVCKLDTGFSFCLYKVFAQAFKDANYITCDPAKPEFVPEKKPAALPQLVHRGPLSAAATSSLLLVPLTAAAALLLRH